MRKINESNGLERKDNSNMSFNIDYHEIIECITGALDAKDPYTANHSQRVSDMAEVLAKGMGLPEELVEKVHIAGHLHDIGKIGVPDNVLMKPGKLTEEEWEKMKEHPVIGAKILERSEHLRELCDIVMHHHERYDGKGYPSGLKGEKIPVGARIIAICDSIDAMTSKRCYRDSLGWDICYQEIEKNIGIMYDPEMGKYALEHWEELKNAGATVS